MTPDDSVMTPQPESKFIPMTPGKPFSASIPTPGENKVLVNGTLPTGPDSAKVKWKVFVWVEDKEINANNVKIPDKCYESDLESGTNFNQVIDVQQPVKAGHFLYIVLQDPNKPAKKHVTIMELPTK